MVEESSHHIKIHLTEAQIEPQTKDKAHSQPFKCPTSW